MAPFSSGGVVQVKYVSIVLTGPCIAWWTTIWPTSEGMESKPHDPNLKRKKNAQIQGCNLKL